MSGKIQEAVLIFRNQTGVLRSREARALGINANTLSRMVALGLLYRETRGVYRLATNALPTSHDFITISKRVPKGVICLVSALNYYQLTTQIPHFVYIALPHGHKTPVVDHPPLSVVHLTKAIYEAGIETNPIDGIPVLIYSREKTIADCFKFRNKIGLDIAIEALTDYLRQPGIDLPKLQHYATLNRVQNVIKPYLAALV